MCSLLLVTYAWWVVYIRHLKLVDIMHQQLQCDRRKYLTDLTVSEARTYIYFCVNVISIHLEIVPVDNLSPRRC